MKEKITDEVPDTIGGRIRYYRQREKLSQEKAAGLLGISRAALNARELDKTEVTLSEAWELSQILKVNPAFLCWKIGSENTGLHVATGLSDDAIEVLKEYEIKNGSKRMKSLSLALSSFGVLDALARYVAFMPKLQGYFLSSRIKPEKDGTFIICRMSLATYKSVIGQSLLHELDKLSGCAEDYPFEAAEVFDVIPDEEGGAEDAEEK